LGANASGELIELSDKATERGSLPPPAGQAAKP
jgi:hypothetical protein